MNYCGGIKGEKGEPGINAIPSLTMVQFKIMKGAFWAIIVCLIIMIVTPVIIFSYPFQAVRFVVPVQIINTDKKIPCNGTIDLDIFYEKRVNTPGLTVMTLGYEKDGLFFPLDSTTVVSDLPQGKGEVHSHYTLSSSPALVGKNRVIRFFIYHWIFGVRPVLDKFYSETFEIIECPAKN